MAYAWKRCESYFSEYPATRWGATLTPIDNKLYLIGGSNYRTYFDNIVCYNLSLKTWEITKGSISSRSGHVTTVLFKRYILVHGGRYIEKDKTSHILSDFVCFDTSTDLLKKVTINLSKDIIGKLCYHSWCVDDRNEDNPIIYMFGGRNENNLSRKFYKLGVKKQNNTICIDVHELELPEASPSPRIFHTFNYYDNHYIRLIGGCSFDYKSIYNDSWIYNTKKNTWRQDDDDDDYGKSGHTVECIGEKLFFIFGGMYSNYETVNRLEVKSHSNDYNIKLNSLELSPGSRRGHSSCHIGKVMFIFGGFNGSVFYNDLYMFGKKTDIQDLETDMFNHEVNIYCNKYNGKIHIPNTMEVDETNNNNKDKKTNKFYYDSRLLSYYPAAYRVAKRNGYKDLASVTNALGEMIDNCENPDEEINENSFTNYLDLGEYGRQSKFYELQRRIREKTEQQQNNRRDITFKCRICNKNEISHVLIPCGCYCACEKCAKSAAGKNCPSCRKSIQSSNKLYVDNNK